MAKPLSGDQATDKVATNKNGSQTLNGKAEPVLERVIIPARPSTTRFKIAPTVKVMPAASIGSVSKSASTLERVKKMMKTISSIICRRFVEMEGSTFRNY